MYGYDRRSLNDEGIKTLKELEASLRKRQRFVDELMKATAPNTGNSEEDQLHVLERIIIFETLHETALTATSESLLKDLNRLPHTPNLLKFRSKILLID